MSQYDIRYEVEHNGGGTTLPPITLTARGRGFDLQDYLTPQEACALGAELQAVGLRAETEAAR